MIGEISESKQCPNVTFFVVQGEHPNINAEFSIFVYPTQAAIDDGLLEDG